MRRCTRCILDETISTIRFDSNGVCNFCHSHDSLVNQIGDVKPELTDLIKKIKSNSKNRDYDCIVGVSGGTDSSYTLHKAVELGLRPLAVFFDNGWSSDISVSNIKNLTDALKVDLHTHVVNWEEFKAIQVAFLKASVPCIEAPTDVGISGTLFRLANQEGVRSILTGQSFITEGTVPKVWSYLDGTYVKTVTRQFAEKSFRFATYPSLNLSQIFYYTFLKGIVQIPFLNYFDYKKEEAQKFLSEKYGWRNYDGHHYENLYSKFAFGWYLPEKFNIDKRKITLSAQIRTGEISREEGLKRCSERPEIDPELVSYVKNKLGISDSEFDSILEAPNKTYLDYKTSDSVLKYCRYPIKMAVKMKFFTPVLYEKYFEM